MDDRHVGTLARQDGDGAADAGIAARDERPALREPQRAPIRAFAVVGLGSRLIGEARLLLVLRREAVVVVSGRRIGRGCAHTREATDAVPNAHGG